MAPYCCSRNGIAIGMTWPWHTPCEGTGRSTTPGNHVSVGMGACNAPCLPSTPHTLRQKETTMPVYAEYRRAPRRTPTHMSDMVPWRAILAPGVVLQKDRHGLQRTYA